MHIPTLKTLGRITSGIQNLTLNLTFRIVDLFAISDKPIEQIENVINVSNPECYALSSDTSLELITTTVIEIQGYLCISYVFILKRLPW